LDEEPQDIRPAFHHRKPFSPRGIIDTEFSKSKNSMGNKKRSSSNFAASRDHLSRAANLERAQRHKSSSANRKNPLLISDYVNGFLINQYINFKLVKIGQDLSLQIYTKIHQVTITIIIGHLI
jgi:hypothetical protein